MANQSMFTNSTQDELCNWEFINHFDFELDSDVDDESIYEIESIDLAESIDSVSSSVEDDDKDEEEEKDFPMNEGNLCGDVNGVNFSRVSDLGQNRGFDDDDLNNFVDYHNKNDGFVENFNGSRLDFDGVGSDGEGLSIYLHKHSPSSYYDEQLSNLHEHGRDDGNLIYTHTHDDDDDDDDDGHDDDVSDMDDDLIPWDVKDLLVKQRVRKSGKNSFRRLAKAKKSALVFTRPGCVRGKHGLGLNVY